MAASSSGRKKTTKPVAKKAKRIVEYNRDELARAEAELFDDYVPGPTSDVPDFRDVGGGQTFLGDAVSARSQYDASLANMNQLFLRTEVLADKVKAIMEHLSSIQGTINRVNHMMGVKEGKF